MSKTPTRVMAMDVREIDGKMVVVLRGKDKIGRNVEMMIPTEGWDAVFADGASRINAFRNAQDEPVGGWSRSFHHAGVPCRVASTDDGKVLVIARHRLPSEVRLLFEKADAQAVAQEILDTLAGAPIPPKAN